MGRQNQKNQAMAAMHVRVRPSVKAAAVRMAQEDKCSMAEWLEWLIEAEAGGRGGKKGRGPQGGRRGASPPTPRGGGGGEGGHASLGPPYGVRDRRRPPLGSRNFPTSSSGVFAS